MHSIRPLLCCMMCGVFAAPSAQYDWNAHFIESLRKYGTGVTNGSRIPSGTHGSQQDSHAEIEDKVYRQVLELTGPNNSAQDMVAAGLGVTDASSGLEIQGAASIWLQINEAIAGSHTDWLRAIGGYGKSDQKSLMGPGLYKILAELVGLKERLSVEYCTDRGMSEGEVECVDKVVKILEKDGWDDAKLRALALAVNSEYRGFVQYKNQLRTPLMLKDIASSLLNKCVPPAESYNNDHAMKVAEGLNAMGIYDQELHDTLLAKMVLNRHAKYNLDAPVRARASGAMYATQVAEIFAQESAYWSEERLGSLAAKVCNPEVQQSLQEAGYNSHESRYRIAHELLDRCAPDQSAEFAEAAARMTELLEEIGVGIRSLLNEASRYLKDLLEKRGHQGVGDLKLSAPHQATWLGFAVPDCHMYDKSNPEVYRNIGQELMRRYGEPVAQLLDIWESKRELRREQAHQRAAWRIQSYWRMRRDRGNYAGIVDKITRIQKSYRRYLAKSTPELSLPFITGQNDLFQDLRSVESPSPPNAPILSEGVRSSGVNGDTYPAPPGDHNTPPPPHNTPPSASSPVVSSSASSSAGYAPKPQPGPRYVARGSPLPYAVARESSAFDFEFITASIPVLWDVASRSIPKINAERIAHELSRSLGVATEVVVRAMYHVTEALGRNVYDGEQGVYKSKIYTQIKERVMPGWLCVTQLYAAMISSIRAHGIEWIAGVRRIKSYAAELCDYVKSAFVRPYDIELIDTERIAPEVSRKNGVLRRTILPLIRRLEVVLSPQAQTANLSPQILVIRDLPQAEYPGINGSLRLAQSPVVLPVARVWRPLEVRAQLPTAPPATSPPGLSLRVASNQVAVKFAQHTNPTKQAMPKELRSKPTPRHNIKPQGYLWRIILLVGRVLQWVLCYILVAFLGYGILK